MKILTIALALCLPAMTLAAQERWELDPASNGISMDIPSNSPHSDHIEMCGKKMATVLYWNLDKDGHFSAVRSLVFPLLRTIPNNTHASLMVKNNLDVESLLRVDGQIVRSIGKKMEINGAVKVVSDWSYSRRNSNKNLTLTRTIFPSTESPVMFERYSILNSGDQTCSILVPDVDQKYFTDPEAGVKGTYVVEATVNGSGAYTLKPGETLDFDLVIQAYEKNGGSHADYNAAAEYESRMAFVEEMDGSLQLETPDPVIDREFRFAKIRASESIIKTKGGYMHAPGGESYYAAIWTNDQAEYVNPFFPFTGYDIGNESAINAYRHFARFMNDKYEPIPSSIIAEGDDIWNGAGDRGDAAMIAYGASRFALTYADRQVAEQLWPLIEWTIEYCKRNLNEYGVVASDSDELEGRFPSGDANLCTSTLYYDALISAGHLATSLGKDKKIAKDYSARAKALAVAIEKFFGAEVKGYDTYRYYDGNDLLRSWICMPLVVGIFDRAEQTLEALFKSDLYTKDGLLSEQGNDTFWDRSTLYAFRGGYYADYADFITPELSAYSHRRLLGDHVPYPIEAWPEGSQRHLSAESGLYCRIITEGMFGIRPTGFSEFEVKINIPANWDHASLKHIKAFGSDFDINVVRTQDGKLKLEIVNHVSGKTKAYSTSCGKILKIKL